MSSNLGFATQFGLNVKPNAQQGLSNVFGDSDSDEDEMPQKPQDIVRFQLEQQRKKVEQEMAQKQAAVTKHDPTAFEYDEVFEDLKKSDSQYQEKKQLKQSIRGKPKYVDKLIMQAEKRKHQNDLWYEKKLQRELEVEKEAYGETEKFVTPSYKRHLEELKAFEEKQKVEEAQNEAERAKKGMQGFYANMLGFGCGKREAPTEQPANEPEPASKRIKEEPLEEHKKTAPAAEQLGPEEAATSAAEAAASKSVVLDLSSAVGVKEETPEQRQQRLEQLNQTSLTEEKVMSAKERYMARKAAAAAAAQASVIGK